MKCKYCNKPIVKGVFCNKTCYGRYKSANAALNPIDEQLKLIASYTDGQLPLGILEQIGKTHGVSRERVRQRAKVLGLVGYREINKEPRMCMQCDRQIEKTNHRAKYCSPECKETYTIVHAKRYSKTCPECGIEFSYKNRAQYRRFCSRRCLGKNNGKNNNLYRARIQEIKKSNIALITRAEYQKRFKIGKRSGWLQLHNAEGEGLVKQYRRGIYTIL